MNLREAERDSGCLLRIADLTNVRIHLEDGNRLRRLRWHLQVNKKPMRAAFVHLSRTPAYRLSIFDRHEIPSRFLDLASIGSFVSGIAV